MTDTAKDYVPIPGPQTMGDGTVRVADLVFQNGRYHLWHNPVLNPAYVAKILRAVANDLAPYNTGGSGPGRTNGVFGG